jgi:hypothetical protein
VWDRSACPVDERCAGCGATGDELHVMLSWFGPDEVACATVCNSCDGRSMLHLSGVGFEGIGARVREHRSHTATAG